MTLMLPWVKHLFCLRSIPWEEEWSRGSVVPDPTPNMLTGTIPSVVLSHLSILPCWRGRWKSGISPTTLSAGWGGVQEFIPFCDKMSDNIFPWIPEIQTSPQRPIRSSGQRHLSCVPALLWSCPGICPSI